VAPLTVASPRTALSAADGVPVVLDPAEETWARFAPDDVTLAALPDLLPAMTDPLMRASVWNAVRDATANALLDPRVALDLATIGLAGETQDQGVTTIGSFGLDLAKRLLNDPAPALPRIQAAARSRADTAPTSAVRLAAVRVLIGSGTDAAELLGWLAGDGGTAGIEVDLDLRWRLLIRLASLGAVDRPELQRQLDAQTTGEAKVHHTQALASLPDEEAKAFAWDRFSGAVEASNYELAAAGHGMWHRGQEELTAPYVDRYFAEVAGTVKVRSGWLLADAAREFFPRLCVHRSAVDAARGVLADRSLDLSLRRALVDETDDLSRAVQVRETFPA
jgi:aminopeptidase N